jgi:hypothetical protein
MYEEENIKSEFEERGNSNPFRTPEGYFGSLEDRIMGAIEQPAKTKYNSSRIVRFLKPALGLAASFTLVYLLVYYPINILLLKNTAKTEIATVNTFDFFNDYPLNYSLIDDSTLVNTIYSDEESLSEEINSDEMLAYLSTGMNEVEIYSEIQN